MKNSKRTLDKWKKLFDSGIPIEFTYKDNFRYGYTKVWNPVTYWNLYDWPNIYFKFRKTKV